MEILLLSDESLFDMHWQHATGILLQLLTEPCASIGQISRPYFSSEETVLQRAVAQTFLTLARHNHVAARKIAGLMDPNLLLALLPGGDVVVKQQMGFCDPLASGLWDGKSVSTGPNPVGGISGVLGVRGPTHCPRLAQMLLRTLAVTYPWEGYARQQPRPHTLDTQSIWEYLHTLLDAGPFLKAEVTEGPATAVGVVNAEKAPSVVNKGSKEASVSASVGATNPAAKSTGKAAKGGKQAAPPAETVPPLAPPLLPPYPRPVQDGAVECLLAMTASSTAAQANRLRPCSSIFDAVARLARDGPTSRPHRVLPLALLLADAGRSHVLRSQAGPSDGNESVHCSTFFSTSPLLVDTMDGHLASVSTPPAHDCDTKACAPSNQQPPEGISIPYGTSTSNLAGNEMLLHTEQSNKDSQEAVEAHATALTCGYLKALDALGSACTAISDSKTPAPPVIARAEVCLLDAAQNLPVQVLVQATSAMQPLKPCTPALTPQPDSYTLDDVADE
eukprot:jgi/Botrbrau1/18508/Bobra.0072s0086.3